jgi:hypothetical protein
MKKIFTLALMAFCMTTGLHAQEYNMFNPTDCDAEGWLWFNTQANVDKYVGLIDEDEEAVNPKGALIQMVYANVSPDFPATTVDANIMGYGTDGELGTEGALKGAIILQPSSAIMNYNGGAVVVRMPSCSTFAVCVSSPDKACMQLNASTDPQISKFGLVVASSVFNPFARAGVTKVTGLQNKANGSTGNTFKSDTPKYAMLRNGTKDTIYVHGFKITTPKPESTGIREVAAGNNAKADVYTADGILVAAQVSEAQIATLKKGLYVVKRGKNVKKLIVK